MIKPQKPPIIWQDIKLIIFDCDGVLTDGKIIFNGEQIELKHFCAHDGMGFTLLHTAGIIPAVITGRSSEALSRRCKELNIKHLYQGIQKKLPRAQKLLHQLHLDWSQVAYMGDDWNDIPVMLKAAVAFCPADAMPEIKELADHVTLRAAGDGAVRECIDYLLYKQGIYDRVVEKYLQDVSE